MNDPNKILNVNSSSVSLHLSVCVDVIKANMQLLNIFTESLDIGTIITRKVRGATNFGTSLDLDLPSGLLSLWDRGQSDRT